MDAPVPSPAPPSPPPARGKLLLFRLLTLGLVCGTMAAAAEWLLGWQQARIQESDRLDPGLVQYDPALGWRLAPGWSGEHRHHDFAARYTTQPLGWRGDTPAPAPRATVFVGDSFTFGFGVGDAETFCALLARDRRIVNAGVPGYSTDQELLLIEQRILGLAPSRIVLMVYLGNDLLDNQYPAPLQVNSPKPYFETGATGLVLRNSPVPMLPGVRAPGQEGLMAAVLGKSRPSLKFRLEQRSELWRIFSQAALPERSYAAEFAGRFAPAVRLFDQLVERLAARCAARGVELEIGVLAGRSFFHQPGSISAQYQEYFRQHVVACCKRREIPVLDLAAALQARFPQRQDAWFFPHDGHLTAAGHRVVAEILADRLRAKR